MTNFVIHFRDEVNARDLRDDSEGVRVIPSIVGEWCVS